MTASSTNTPTKNKNTVRATQKRELLMLLGFLIVIWAITTALSPRFLTPANLSDILIQAAPLGFVVIGQMIVIIVRGLDLSVASIMATVAVLSTSLIDSTPFIFAIGLLLGAMIGAVNGYLVAYPARHAVSGNACHHDRLARDTFCLHRWCTGWFAA